MAIIGIDLGTSNSAAAVLRGGRPVIIPSAEGVSLEGIARILALENEVVALRARVRELEHALGVLGEGVDRGHGLGQGQAEDRHLAQPLSVGVGRRPHRKGGVEVTRPPYR